MKRYKLLNIIAVLLLVSTLSAQAQEERNQGIEHRFAYPAWRILPCLNLRIGIEMDYQRQHTYV